MAQGCAQNEAREEEDGAKKTDCSSEKRKSQAQRLFEFQLWTDDKTFKDLEYTQRRTEKQQRRREERRDARRQRCWKRLYLPSVLAMMGGTMLTLCATLQTLGADTFLWHARSALVVLGPVMLGLGFLGLMLAAGCTFSHEQEIREQPKPPPPQFQLNRWEARMQRAFSRSSSSAVRRSTSMDTRDMPLPPDLYPDINTSGMHPDPPGQSGADFIERYPQEGMDSRDGELQELDPCLHGPRRESGSPAKGGNRQTVSEDRRWARWWRKMARASRVRAGGGVHAHSYTISWVQGLSLSPQQQRALLTRQHSDSNMLNSSARLLGCADTPRSLGDSTEVRDHHTDWHSDLHVVCTRSLTSSGYHSTSENTSATVDCSKGFANGYSWWPERHRARTSIHHTSGTELKSLAQAQGVTPSLLDKCCWDSTISQPPFTHRQPGNRGSNSPITQGTAGGVQPSPAMESFPALQMFERKSTVEANVVVLKNSVQWSSKDHNCSVTAGWFSDEGVGQCPTSGDVCVCSLAMQSSDTSCIANIVTHTVDTIDRQSYSFGSDNACSGSDDVFLGTQYEHMCVGTNSVFLRENNRSTRTVLSADTCMNGSM